jgi:ElaB/YqjD/DUF883 family membrane-anchored ribosome-binding protein
VADESVESRISDTRAELESTLDQLEDKLNVKKQAGVLADKAKSAYNANPVPWIAGATAIGVGVLGLVAWAIFSGDD